MKIEIDIRDNITPAMAIELVKRVVKEGKISKGERGMEYYCWLTTFDTNEGEKMPIPSDLSKKLLQWMKGCNREPLLTNPYPSMRFLTIPKSKKRMKSYTDIEQSRKLVELGLDPSTADMYYIQMMDEDGCYDEAHIWVAETVEEKLQCEAYKTPAWSLAALLELMPDIIKVEEECYTFSLIKNVIEYVGHDGNILYSTGGESFVDAAVKMFELIEK